MSKLRQIFIGFIFVLVLKWQNEVKRKEEIKNKQEMTD